MAGLQVGAGFYRLGTCSVNWDGEQANTSATRTAFGTFSSFSFGLRTMVWLAMLIRILELYYTASGAQ